MTATTTEAGAQARAARIAGAMYLVTMATAMLVELYVRGSLIVRGDAAKTAENIIESERLFRAGIAIDLVTFTGVLVLVWALHTLLKPVDRSLALLAAFLRLAELTIHYAATLYSFVALLLLSDAAYLNAFEAGQLHALARVALSAQGAGLNMGFILLGLGSTVFAFLFWRSGYVPKALAGLGVAASLLLAMYALVVIVFPGARSASYALMLPMFIYEVTLGLWLLLKGARIGSSAPTSA
jgi:hypothetical protein